MRLTVYTDYTLRIMMYLTVMHKEGALTTIDSIVDAYKISRAHVAKIVYELALTGMIVTVRGRSGGIRLAQSPEEISIGALVRLAEKDFSIVACHDQKVSHDCIVFPACNLTRIFRKAVDAFMQELDAITLADAITSHRVASDALGLHGFSIVAMPMPQAIRSDQPPLQNPAAKKSNSSHTRKD